ncbi:winged helix-turn-helix domain-containing protein [Halobacteria archaeon HArc-gm2]|nr:winged helix-turn-helix domain-containing protein [Halobacteria archaeon HArc-gm2]
MPTPPAPDEYDDVNEAVKAEWEAETTPYERVRQVVSLMYTPTSVDSIAEDALTTPKTAREHLEALAEEGFVETENGERGGTDYRRSPKSLVVEQAVAILDTVSVEELTDRITEMRHTIASFQECYDVESLEALTVDQTNDVLGDGAADGEGIDPETLREWQTTRRNLAFANVALSIATAERIVDPEAGGADGDVAVE